MFGALKPHADIMDAIYSLFAKDVRYFFEQLHSDAESVVYSNR